MELFSVGHSGSKEIVEYEVMQNKTEELGYRLAEKGRFALGSTVYGWCKDELIVSTDTSIRILLDGKEMQRIDNLR